MLAGYSFTSFKEALSLFLQFRTLMVIDLKTVTYRPVSSENKQTPLLHQIHSEPSHHLASSSPSARSHPGYVNNAAPRRPHCAWRHPDASPSPRPSPSPIRMASDAVQCASGASTERTLSVRSWYGGWMKHLSFWPIIGPRKVSDVHVCWLFACGGNGSRLLEDGLNRYVFGSGRCIKFGSGDKVGGKVDGCALDAGRVAGWGLEDTVWRFRWWRGGINGALEDIQIRFLYSEWKRFLEHHTVV